MTIHGRRVLVALVCGGLMTATGELPAQIRTPQMPLQLPSNDFTWVWGNRTRAQEARSPTFNTDGTDGGFDCELQGRLTPGQMWTHTEIVRMESEIRTAQSFVEATLSYMGELNNQRALDWARLECRRFRTDDRPSSETPGVQADTVWLDVTVSLYEAFPADAGGDAGHWTASFNQAQAWRLRSSRPDSRATYTIRPEGLLLPSALHDVDGSAWRICVDNGSEWRTEWSGPVEPGPVSLSVSNEGGDVVLWVSVPDVLMQHPGDAHIDAASSCHSADQPFMDRLQLNVAALARGGAVVNDAGSLRLASFSWSEVAEVMSGQAASIPLQLRHEVSDGGQRILFEVQGTLGQRPAAGN